MNLWKSLDFIDALVWAVRYQRRRHVLLKFELGNAFSVFLWELESFLVLRSGGRVGFAKSGKKIVLRLGAYPPFLY